MDLKTGSAEHDDTRVHPGFLCDHFGKAISPIDHIISIDHSVHAMQDTPHSLLARFCRHRDDEAWWKLDALYRPFLQRMLEQARVAKHDRDDLVQDVMTALVEELPRFEHNGRTGAFRAWLRKITYHRTQRFWEKRRRQPKTTGGTDFTTNLQELADETSGLSRLWDGEHDRHVMKSLFALVQAEFQPNTWAAFQAVVLEGQTSTQAAENLGISANAVLVSKSRVLRRLRQLADGLVDF